MHAKAAREGGEECYNREEHTGIVAPIGQQSLSICRARGCHGQAGRTNFRRAIVGFEAGAAMLSKRQAATQEPRVA